MEDPLLLKQKLEFLQMELDDLKAKEQQQKSMYESMIKSLTSDTDQILSNKASEELQKVESQYQTQIQAMKAKHKQKINALEEKLKDYKEKNYELEKAFKDQKSEYDEVILQLKQENCSLAFQKREIEGKLKEICVKPDNRVNDRLIKENENLRKEIDRVKEESEEDIKKSREQAQKHIQELKEIYDQEKINLEKQCQKLSQELSLQREKIEAEIQAKNNQTLGQRLEEVIDESTYQMEELRRAREEAGEIVGKWKGELTNLVQHVREQLNKSPDCSPIKSVDESQDLLKFAECTREEIKKLRSQLICFQKVIKTLEYNEDKLRQQVRERDDEIDKLKRIIRFKAKDEKTTDYQYLIKQRDELTEQLIIKETELYKIKKQIGDLRCEMSSSTTKPPVYSPRSKHFRSNTTTPKEDLTESVLIPCKEELSDNKINNNAMSEDFQNYGKLQRMINCSKSMECEFCRKILPTGSFHDHILNCKLEIDSSSDTSQINNDTQLDKIEELEKQISHLKISLGKIKNQKAAALIENEKLLLGLKEAKLKWVMAEEKSAEIQLEMKNEMRGLLDVLIKYRQAVILPPALSTEIELAIHNSARFFGGRINVKSRSRTSPTRQRVN
ncbi:unnamed protein product [Blepharisma stoltei]|uniref:Uncharacterized protein n=1 Tax=Blepharisma stoltei TaxID=1481888 RepID=A0AAU9JK20_9CILI|nr:unnamed protein product [Blepharisma stoltei]